jgi:hypothetical protein
MRNFGNSVFARGKALPSAKRIVAEPPVGADLCVCPKGDGADSPTRASPKGAQRSGSPKLFFFLAALLGLFFLYLRRITYYINV